MLQVIERVLTSRSEATLVALIAIVAFLFLVLGLQDHARARVLARTEARFLARMDPREGLVSDHRAYRKIDPDHAERYRASFAWRYEGCYQLLATILRFVLKLISRLQFSGTVPMIDVQAYAEWLSK